MHHPVSVPAILLSVALAVFPAGSQASPGVASTTRYHDEALGLTVVSGECRLPADGGWTLAQPTPGGGLRQVFHEITNREELQAEGERARANRIDREVRSVEWRIRSCYDVLQQFAAENEGRGPASIEDPALLEIVALGWHGRQMGAAVSAKERAANLAEFRQQTTGLGLVPNAAIPKKPADPFAPKGPADAAAPPPTPLLVELAPLRDDGRHWVLHTNGESRRETIDTALLERLGLALSTEGALDGPQAPRATEQHVRVYALAAADASGMNELVFEDSLSGRRLAMKWDLATAAAGERKLLSTWATLRAAEWEAFVEQGEASLLRSWLQIAKPLYGAEIGIPEDARGAEGPSLLALLGGRAAVEETLQQQALERPVAAGDTQPGTTVALADIRGVEVASHPFAEMARGESPPTLALANLVPPDRAFFHVARPAALQGFLASESAFSRRVGSLARPSADHRLRERYAAELGLTRPLIDSILESGLLAECALFSPDLFFADGTDITVIARVRSGTLLTTLLKPVLASLPAREGVHEIPTATGTAYWSVEGDVWIVSNHAAEHRAALALSRADGEGSLGRSDEFRHMLHKLPPEADTRAYVYFSDGFIRRLVGPEVKIAQSRRLAARVAMERMVGASLLRRLDAPGTPTDKETLARLGYLRADEVADDITLGADHSASSATFGPLARMKPLSAQASSLARVTAAEAAAYERYRENYTRFWSRFFDPIALRFDTAADGSHALTTFILPLIENSAYDTLRSTFAAPDQRPSASSVPLFDRTPVARLDLVLPDKTWRGVAAGLDSLFEREFGISSEFYDLLGPAVHVAVEDGDPVVRLGSGELAGAFASAAGVNRGMRGSEMVYIGVLLNLLTRPTHIAVELTDPERAARLLENAYAKRGPSAGRDWVETDFVRRGPGREWLLSFRPERIASIDFSVRVEGRYLIVSNHPWGEPLRITGERPGGLAGVSLTFHPEARATSLPADFASAMRSERSLTLKGMGRLYPWMMALGESRDGAERANLRALGFAPSTPPGEPAWQGGELLHPIFGGVWTARLPVYDRAARFGLFEGLSGATVSMQFEDDGLRTKLVWRSLPAK